MRGKIFSRRNILGGLALGAGGSALAMSGPLRKLIGPEGEAQGSWWRAGRIALARSGMEAWAAQLGSVFTIAAEAGDASFKLAEVRPLEAAGERPPELARNQAFLLVFEGEGAHRPAGNQTYSARHATGQLDIFFSAADPTASVPRLEAVFN